MSFFFFFVGGAWRGVVWRVSLVVCVGVGRSNEKEGLFRWLAVSSGRPLALSLSVIVLKV